MDIKSKLEHDPVADLSLINAYMRWALLATEEVVGKQGLDIVLREAGLERLVGAYPPADTTFSAGLTFGDYAALSAGLLKFYGRAGKGILLRIGRLANKQAVEEQSALFGVAVLTAAKLLPTPALLKLGLESTQKGFRKLSQPIGQDQRLWVEDRGDKLAYIAQDCAMCAGKQADRPMCVLFTGSLQQGCQWLTGKEFEVEEVECRAMGAPACVWEISKTPR